ncbi:hypothetical protein MPSEU_000453600 [Mayamaea pseudoterrestris]|nr:hypothetical protein MPSEU_000453600 [Mayamaea pseudoterrestris]
MITRTESTMTLAILLLLLTSETSAFSTTTRRTSSSQTIRRKTLPFFISTTTPTTAAPENVASLENSISPTTIVSNESFLVVDAASAAAPEHTISSMLERAVGKVSDDRFHLIPEYSSGKVPRLFSSLTYDEITGQAQHVSGSVLGAAALICGTTIGAGVLALPQATAAAGFLPSSFAMISAYVYMTMSGLLIAELIMNQMGTTGKTGTGLLQLYKSSLNAPLSALGSGAYFFLHYAVMIAYFAQGGVNVDGLLQSVGVGGSVLEAVPGLGQAVFATVCGLSLYATRPDAMQKVNNVLVAGVGAAFLGILTIGAQTADFGTLIDPVNQHPSQVVNCLPILFLALVYQNVVPTVVNQLEGDRTKVMQAIIAGTTAPLLMFLAWNAIVLGNVAGADLGGMDPVALLQQASGGQVLGPLVATFSSLALVTSVIGFTHGLLDAWTDVFKVSPETIEENGENSKLKAPLYALVFGPPLLLSMANPDIFYSALEYGGAFGVSVLFLFLPPIMVWSERYGEEAKPLVAKPMVPFGKLALGSMYKIAATLVLEQGAEKLGVFDYIKEHFLA